MDDYSSEFARDLVGGDGSQPGKFSIMSKILIVVTIVLIISMILYIIYRVIIAAQRPNPYSEYKSMGCWKDDGGDRVLRTRVPGFSYKDGVEAIPKCGEAAKVAGMKVFGVQTGGECWIDTDATRDYKALGSAESCSADGTGGPYANNIYEWN